jgi:competence protein ComEC
MGRMPSRRTPLFSVALAFATGCLVGLDGWMSCPVALTVLLVAGAIWWLLARRDGASLTAFFALTACAGLTHTLLVARTIAPDDLRRLPEEKSFPTTQWRGVVIEEPVEQLSTHTARHATDRISFVLRAEAWRPTGGRFFAAPVETPWRPARGDVQCTLVGPSSEIRCGDRLEAAAALVPVPAPLCPGGLDYRAYEAEQGIYYHAALAPQNWRRIETGGGNFWQDLSFRARDWAYARLQIGLEDDPRTADFLAGMLIGYRQEIPADIEQDFRRTGTLHVFAVSGQNIAELVVVAFVLLQLCGLVRWRWAWTIAPVVLLYCLLTGSPASAVRATVMIMAVLLAWRLGRPMHALGCWSLALLAMLIWNPAILLDPGAQLSFGVVLGLILIGPPLKRLLQRPFVHDPFLPYDLLSRGQKREDAFWRTASAVLGATIAATLVSEPITAVDFHQVTPISVLANLVVVPTAGLITVVGTLGVTASLFSTTWAMLLNNANWLFARLLIAFVGFLAHEPGASLNVPDVRAIGSPLPSFVVAPLQDSACLLVRTPGGAWLFNTGREIPARATTTHLLQFYGINRLDALVLMQMSTSDNGGAAQIVRDFHPRRLVVPLLRTRSPMEKAMPAVVTLAGQPAETWQRGERFSLAPEVSVEVLNPEAEGVSTQGEDRALVLLFHAGDQSLLWAGKISAELQQELLTAYPGLRADILVAGQEAPPSAEWLRALQVRYWLQIPRGDRQLNAPTEALDANGPCQSWPLDQTGAVILHFAKAQGPHPATIALQPWVALPALH